MSILLKSTRFATFVDLNLSIKLTSNVFTRQQAYAKCLKTEFSCNSQRKLHASIYHCKDDTKKNDAQNKASAVTEKPANNTSPHDLNNLKMKKKYSKVKHFKHHHKDSLENSNKVTNGNLQKSIDGIPVTGDLTQLSKKQTVSKNDSDGRTSKSKDPTLWQSLVDSQMDNSAPGREKKGLETTSMKNMKQPSRNSNEETMKLIMDVVAELNPEKGNIAKKKRERLDLSNKMQDIRTHKRESPKDFESLLGEMMQSDTDDYFSRKRQHENRTGKLQIDLRFTAKRHFFPNLKLSEVEEEQGEKQQSEWSAVDWYNHYKSECDGSSSLDLDKHFPWSAYDEMIRWTKDGKLWTFPINNESDMDLEADTPFYKHVFLEDKLNEGGWCPKEGPIRLFMTSVITALSSNPFLSVQTKHEHIEWFRDYFTERLDTLKNLGLIEQSTLTSQQS